MDGSRTHRGTGARRQAILDAALACFTERGFETTTMADIRDAAGASIGSLYHHYGSKDALAVSLVASALGSYFASWLDRLGDAADPEPSVRAAIHAHFDWLDRNQGLGTILFAHPTFADLGKRSHEVAQLRADFNGTLLDWIRPRVGRRGLAHLPDDVYQPLWIGPAHEITQSWVGWERLGDLAVLADQLADGAWAALRWRR